MSVSDRWNIPAPVGSVPLTVRARVAELVKQHGGLRPAARVLRMTPQYLYRLGNGEKKNASAKVLRKLGLRRVVYYERILGD